MPCCWWALPGPAQFVEQVVRDIQGGRNVLLCLPSRAPSGLDAAVRHRLNDTMGMYWNSIDAREDSGRRLVDILYERFVPEAEPGTLRTAGSLAIEPSFCGQVLWVRGMTTSVWPQWKSLLREYANACRSRDELERNTFAVCLDGELAVDPPPEDVCLVSRQYRGFVRRIDMLVFADSCFDKASLGELTRELAMQIVANLAIWDPALAETLAAESIRVLLKPWDFLVELASRSDSRGVERESPSRSWQFGCIDIVEGCELEHTLAVVRSNNRHEVDRRLWNAEVGVLLPFVEERRRDILERFKENLRVPHTTLDGAVISDARDLEIGHIHYQFCNNGSIVSQRVRRLVRALRELRNALSHLDPVDPQDLLSEELRDYKAILRIAE